MPDRLKAIEGSLQAQDAGESPVLIYVEPTIDFGRRYAVFLDGVHFTYLPFCTPEATGTDVRQV